MHGPAKEQLLNNLIKNVAIWLVIALVLMTVFNQFSTRQPSQKPMDYSQFIEEVKHRQRHQGDDRRQGHQGREEVRREVRHLSGAGSVDGERPAQERRERRGQAGRRAVLPDADLHLVVPDAAADRRVDFLHAPDAGRRTRRRVLVRQEPRAHARREQQPGHVRRRGRLRGGQGRSDANWSSSCAIRASSRSSADAFRAAC